jgi:exonuclease SbcC
VSVSVEKQEGNKYKDISGVSKIETNKKIVDLVGEYDDILLTNIMLQESKETNFINYQKADRIDFLIRHSSLHIFDKLHSESKISLKKLKQELYATNKGLEKYNSYDNEKLKNYKIEISQFTEEKNILTKKRNTIKSDLNSLYNLGGKGINIIKMDEDYKNACNRINKLQEEQEDLITTRDKLDEQNIQELKDNYKIYVSEKENEKKKIEEDNIKKEYETSNKKFNEPVIRKAIDKLEIKINKINKIIETEEKKTFEYISIPRENEIEGKYNELIETREEIKKLEEDGRIQNKEIDSLKKVVDEYKNYKYDPKCKFCVQNKHTVRSEEAKKKYKILENKHTKIQDQLFEKELKCDKLKNFENLRKNLEKSKEHNNNLEKEKKESEEVLEKNREMIEFYNNQLETKKEKINKIEKNKGINEEINSNKLKIEELEKEIEERGKFMEEYKTMKNKMKNVNTRLPIIKFELDSLIEQRNILEIDLKRYKNVRNVAEKINTNENELEKTTNKLDEIRQRLIELNCNLASLNEKINDKIKLEKNKKDLELAISVYEEYKLIMSRTGIRFKLIEKLLREIEIETNKILSSIVPFKIRIERVENIQSNSEKTKEIIIYKESDGIYQPIGNGSTSEGYLTALAIRLVLLKILDRPRPNFMFIDEGFACLDDTNQEKIGVIFNLINKMNDFSLVITHQDNIKSLCDNSIKINKNSGLSNIVF